MTTPGVADSNRLMRANSHTYSFEAESFERMESIWGFSDQEDTSGSLADHVVTKEHPYEKERLMRVQKMVTVCQKTLRNSITGIPVLIGKNVTALVIIKACNEIWKTESRLEAMLQGLVNKAIDEKLWSINVENCVLRKIEDVASSPRHVTRVTETMLDNQGFVTPLAAIVKKEAETAVDDE